MKTVILISLTVVFLAGSCRHVAFRKYARNMSISYGGGGGFTGAIDEYILKGTGALYRIKAFSHDTVLLRTIDKKTLKKIILYADSKKLRKTEMNTPGNMSRFIHLYRDGRQVRSWQWAEGADIPAELKELNNRLNKLN